MLSFIAIISVIVFVHEFGHFYVARLCGVRVEVFAIGFGRELFGFTDRVGTRWKFCLVPMGGYVKMFGDRNAASIPDKEAAAEFSEEEKVRSFVFKNVYQRMAIVIAGPVANFLLAVVIFWGMFWVNGVDRALPVVGEVLKDSAAFTAGVRAGDEIVEIDGERISDFADMQKMVAGSAGRELEVVVCRGSCQALKITPKIHVRKNIFGEEMKVGLLGVSSGEVKHEDLGVFASFLMANKEVWRISGAIFGAIGDLVSGRRDIKELGGPIKIAKYSGKSTEIGAKMVLWFAAMISINLGVMNLLPLPVLDGGHLVFYVYEAIFGRALPQKVQDLAFQFGFAVVLALMLFTSYNDLVGVFRG